MDRPDAWAVAACLVWFGMVLAISFVEAPLKFRAPGVTVPIGLGIGRLVFQALNGAEAVLAAIAVVALVTGLESALSGGAVVVAVLCLAVQMLLVRPVLSRRTAAVLAGLDAPRSHAHWAYVGLEVVKIVSLGIASVALLAAA